jgi:hypothetical protein
LAPAPSRGRNLNLPILTRISSSLSLRVPPEVPPVWSRTHREDGRARCAETSAGTTEPPCRALAQRGPNVREKRRYVNPPLSAAGSSQRRSAGRYGRSRRIRSLSGRVPGKRTVGGLSLPVEQNSARIYSCDRYWSVSTLVKLGHGD